MSANRCGGQIALLACPTGGAHNSEVPFWLAVSGLRQSKAREIYEKGAGEFEGVQEGRINLQIAGREPAWGLLSWFSLRSIRRTLRRSMRYNSSLGPPPAPAPSVYCDDDATGRREQRIFEAAGVPQPLAIAHAPDRPGRDKQEHGDGGRDIADVDGERQADRADNVP